MSSNMTMKKIEAYFKKDNATSDVVNTQACEIEAIDQSGKGQMATKLSPLSATTDELVNTSGPGDDISCLNSYPNTHDKQDNMLRKLPITETHQLPKSHRSDSLTDEILVSDGDVRSPFIFGTGDQFTAQVSRLIPWKSRPVNRGGIFVESVTDRRFTSDNRGGFFALATTTEHEGSDKSMSELALPEPAIPVTSSVSEHLFPQVIGVLLRIKLPKPRLQYWIDPRQGTVSIPNIIP